MSFFPLINSTKFKNNQDSPKIAKVINNEDPKGKGRIKVQLVGIYDPKDLKGTNLPWIRPMRTTMGVGFTEINIPNIGDSVEVYWPYDNQHAFYRGLPLGASDVNTDLTNYNWGWSFNSNTCFMFNKVTGTFVIKTPNSTISGESNGKIIISGGEIVIDGSNNTKIDGQVFLNHKHYNGNEGNPTGGVIEN